MHHERALNSTLSKWILIGARLGGVRSFLRQRTRNQTGLRRLSAEHQTRSGDMVDLRGCLVRGNAADSLVSSPFSN